MTTNNWREDFDKHFGHYLYDSTYDIDAENQYDNVCDFIETQIAQAREEMKMKCLFICKQEIAYHGASYDERDLIVCGRISNSISSL